MILFYNALAEGESQPPATQLGTVTRLKNGFHHGATHALTVVADIYKHFVFLALHFQQNVTLPFDGVDGVLAQIFNDPLEQGATQRQLQLRSEEHTSELQSRPH